MMPGENQNADTAAKVQPVKGPARWISRVTLGCSLGLMLVLALNSTRLTPRDDRVVTVIYRVRAADQPFNLSEAATEKELTGVIESQLNAFRNDDYTQAYGYAASTLKDRVPLPSFERMVRSGYPIIAHSRSARFGVVLDNGQQALVNVTILGVSGYTRHYQYILQRERNGWKICGVTEVRHSGTTI